MAEDDDPEVREMTELGRIEKSRMGSLRARHILLLVVAIVLAGGALWLLLR